MKNFKFLIFIFLFLLINSVNIKAQKQQAKAWSTNNPFKTDVFVANHGQFNSWVNTDEPIKYAINNADKILFTSHGLIFRLENFEKITEKEREKMERQSPNKKEPDKKMELLYVNMIWEGSNPDAELIAEEQTEGYYTFGEKAFENVKARGYKKLTYKNLYPNIDVEYMIPEKGGIKYSLILHPDADITQVKMKYSGNINKIKINRNGNIVIRTPAGDITDHAPESFTLENNQKISSSFYLEKHTIGFKINLYANNTQTIVVDPWTTTPNSLASNNLALDLDYDIFGNVYVSGGTGPYKLSKYNSTGNFIWTFTNPITWATSSLNYYYSKFCSLTNSGTTFIGEGFQNNPGARIMKINSSGTLTFTSVSFGMNNEIWHMFYNNCSKQLIAFGGGTIFDDNIKIIADTNLSSSGSKSFDGITESYNDIADVEMDNNGDFYAIMTNYAGVTGQEGFLKKSLFSNNYNPPVTFSVQTNHFFQEAYQFYVPGINYPFTVRANAMALNSSFLFTYDGKTLKAWNKNNGTLLNSIIVDNSYSSGNIRLHEGIDVDYCNNIYVGGTNKIHVFNFNGTSFSQLIPITNSIPNNVYDIKINRANGKIYVCGTGFLTEVNAPYPCSLSSINTSLSSSDSCFGKACVTPSGGMPPYHYYWSNGSTDSCIFGVPSGTYIVTVSDNSCSLDNIHTDTVIINSSLQLSITPLNPVICKEDSVKLIASSSSSATTYHWSNGVNGNINIVHPLVTTVYSVIATNNSCIDTFQVTVKVNNFYSEINKTICNGDSYMVGNHIYTASGTYLDKFTSSIGCDSLIKTNLTVTPIPQFSIGNDTSICNGTNVILNVAYPGATYLWQDSSVAPVYIVNQAGQYWVQVSLGDCKNSKTVNIEIIDCVPILEMPNFISPNGDNINDLFVPIKAENIIKMHTIIYNRWGTKVFETDNLNIEWDGKQNGKNLAEGVYFWIINFTNLLNIKYEMKGSVTVMR
ncbi:MAG: gliding motility-associated C-terminal domain-containing protein [Bacteroidetes bacterium]|nr:gliding motility-associated C-terminal domain-containing protein [Bacteroidota bacterium]